ncbi:hypothetical protein [Candidatus Electronema sp. TJ]|uniref:hypothetical protein n=1 Tax=Candidatus Electronema sp. TJ TaxID=3401573 RepID=UPI003AA9AC30
MVRKICLAASLAGVLLMPLKSKSADLTVFNQFVDAANAGLFQGVSAANELTLDSYSDGDSVQGLNVISGVTFSGKVVQVADIEGSLSMTMAEGDNIVQGVNIYRGGNADEIQQVAVVGGALVMTSRNNKDGIQGINVITSN